MQIHSTFVGDAITWPRSEFNVYRAQAPLFGERFDSQAPISAQGSSGRLAGASSDWNGVEGDAAVRAASEADGELVVSCVRMTR